ncbi:Mss4-like protein [Lactarius indigo]|nr:Mss4-like protein [Lactarius indigo]
MSTSTITPSQQLTGACFCGAVTYALTAPPVLRAYCHCTQCQRLTGCPFIHTIHFPASAFAWTHDSPVDSFVNPLKPWKTRTRCRACGVTVSSHNSKTDRTSVWGPHLARDDSGRILRWAEVRPTAHIFYGTRLLDIEDGLGKWEGYEGNSEKIA